MHGAAISPGFLETLGTTPILGRDLSPEESRPGGPAAVLLSYAFWARRFGGDSNVIGQPLVLDDRSYTIVGIMPRGFDYPTRTQAWIALDLDPDTAPMAVRSTHGYIFVARLRPGVSRVQAADATRQAARHLQQEFPTERGWSYGLLTMRQWSIGDDDGRVTSANWRFASGSACPAGVSHSSCSRKARCCRRSAPRAVCCSRGSCGRSFRPSIRFSPTHSLMS